MKKVMTVYGTRPEGIKMAPVIRRLEEDPRFESISVVTGQHREMLDQVGEVLGITPTHDLNVFTPGQTLNEIMAHIITLLDPILEMQRPDAVVVQGDTSTVAAAALTSFNRHVPVVHLEAGLRSGDITAPFPEEANRSIATRISSLHLAPTQQCRYNLEREGIRGESIIVTGNTGIDALMRAVEAGVPIRDERIRHVVASGAPILLVTAHRRENWGLPMERIGHAVARLARRHPGLHVILPAHLNPIVRHCLLPPLIGLDNVIACDPLPYGEFIQVLKASSIVLTDSGGLQEEAPALGKPVLVLRERTDRPEAIEVGAARLVGTDEEAILAEVISLLEGLARQAPIPEPVNPYGDGAAAVRAVAGIAAFLGVGDPLPDFVSHPPARPWPLTRPALAANGAGGPFLGGPTRPLFHAVVVQASTADPPAAASFSFAEFENASAVTLRATLMSPPPSTLTSAPPRTAPASTRSSTVTAPPLGNSSARRPTLMTWYSTRNGFVNPLSFGIRMCIGIWPPSKFAGTFLRAPVPFVPRPAVLPLDASPRPTRVLAVLAPGAGRR